MPEDHWEPALKELEDTESGVFGPRSFREYLEDIGDDPRNYRTAAEISIDTFRQLSPELRQQDTMVFRLGHAPDGVGTGFALVQLENQLEDFFIQEQQYDPAMKEILDFSPAGKDLDLLDQQARDMLDAYRLLPNFSESSFVNLALSTGILGRALELDRDIIGTAPTTVASTFTFDFKPHTRLSQALHHNNGQVEIDAIIIARRQGKRVMLVIEAKTGRQRTLAKHKLFYPYLAVENLVPADVHEVIPLYLRANTVNQDITYDIYEGAVTSPNGQPPAIDDLQIKNEHHYTLQIS